MVLGFLVKGLFEEERRNSTVPRVKNFSALVDLKRDAQEWVFACQDGGKVLMRRLR